jgi:hypothetical protein
LIAIAACPANAVTIASSRSPKGLTSRGAHRRAESGNPLEIETAVTRIGDDVGNLLRFAVQSHPTDQSFAVHGHRVFGDVGDGLLRLPDTLDQLVDAIVEQIEMGGVGSTQAAGTLDDRR